VGGRGAVVEVAGVDRGGGGGSAVVRLNLRGPPVNLSSRPPPGRGAEVQGSRPGRNGWADRGCPRTARAEESGAGIRAGHGGTRRVVRGEAGGRACRRNIPRTCSTSVRAGAFPPARREESCSRTVRARGHGRCRASTWARPSSTCSPSRFRRDRSRWLRGAGGPRTGRRCWRNISSGGGGPGARTRMRSARSAAGPEGVPGAAGRLLAGDYLPGRAPRCPGMGVDRPPARTRCSTSARPSKLPVPGAGPAGELLRPRSTSALAGRGLELAGRFPDPPEPPSAERWTSKAAQPRQRHRQPFGRVARFVQPSSLDRLSSSRGVQAASPGESRGSISAQSV